MKRYVFVFVVLFMAHPLFAQVTLPALIRDSMILQRDEKVNLWGWASPNEKVVVKFNGKSYQSKADKAGKWKVQIAATKAGGPYTIDITASNKISIKNILFGDVWFCSGQSNMVHQLNIHDVTYASEVSNANFPQIRQFLIPTITSLEGPKDNFPTGFWKPAVGEEIRPFSAVAYFFAKKLFEKYQVPIGIINASVGGTPIEAWTSESGLKKFPAVLSTIQKNKDSSYINGLPRSAATAYRQPALQDKGLISSPTWYDINYIPKGWKTIAVPGYWEDQGIKDLDGVVWYRKEIEVPASMIGKSAKVFLGRIVDADIVYINGKQVGSTGYMYPQRRYAIPADILKAGKNIVVVKVINNSGKGGFVTDKPYCLFAGNDTIDLKGYWQYKVGAVFLPKTGAVGAINAQNQPAALYNAMIAPATNYTIKGVCWYQGETNTGHAEEYAKLLPALIRDWRLKWQQDTLPFLYVQLPGFMEYNYLPSESQWAALREAQLKALTVPNTAMVVAIDLGEWNDIHPDNKKEVGERLALAASKIAYRENLIASGPVFKSATVQGSKIIVDFTNTGSGLISNDGEALSEFAIAGADKKFVWAKASIEGDKVMVWSDEIATPVYVRYAWADNPVDPNLYNKEGLPASPFRTDQ